MFEVIVLGATFAAAGIAQKYKKQCLILERRAQAGYEFFGALNFGENYKTQIKEKEALCLQESFSHADEGVYGYNCYIYPYLRESVTLFNTELVSIKQTDNGFLCETHGVGGFCSYAAKKIIDTRSSAEISVSKTYNLLVESGCAPVFQNTRYRKGEMENHYVLQCEVPLSYTFAQAREIAFDVVRQFSKEQRLILSADEFDYQIKPNYPKTVDGIFYLPSKAYDNPILSFEAGLKEAGE